MTGGETLDRLIGNDRIADLNVPIERAKGLPGRTYYDPAVWELERRSIFSRGWFAAAYASEIPEPGDMLPISVAGWELLFVRGADRKIRCFHNLCRHRGTKLILQKGSASLIRCGWHCWTYDLAGGLIRTPRIGGHDVDDVEGIDRATLGLRPVRVEQWMDALFVNIEGRAVPLSSHIGPLDGHLEPFGLGQVKLGAMAQEVEIPANWKLFLEGGLEGYHIPWVHRALEQPPQYKITLGANGDCFIDTSATLRKYKRLGTNGSEPPRFGMMRNAAQADRDGQPLPYSIAFTVPTAIVAAWPEYLMISLIRPVAVDKTMLRRRFYFLGDAAHDPATADARHGLVNFHTNVVMEDLDYVTEVQNMSRLRQDLDIETRFSPYWEGAVRAFQQYVARNARTAPPA